MIFTVKNPDKKSKHQLPPEADEFALCEIFRCTPTELGEQDSVKIARMCEIINLRSEHGN